MRIFLGFLIGTCLNFMLFGMFATANGTPVPSWRQPPALLAYPTGNEYITLACAWVIYFLALAFVFLVFPRRKTPAR